MSARVDHRTSGVGGQVYDPNVAVHAKGPRKILKSKVTKEGHSVVNIGGNNYTINFHGSSNIDIDAGAAKPNKITR